MARLKNPDNVYELTCAVTKVTQKTNPLQFNHLMAKLGLTKDELLASYVSQAGRRILAADNDCKNDPEKAIMKYGLHPVVARSLRATREKISARQIQLIPVEMGVDIEQSDGIDASEPEMQVESEKVEA